MNLHHRSTAFDILRSNKICSEIFKIYFHVTVIFFGTWLQLYVYNAYGSYRNIDGNTQNLILLSLYFFYPSSHQVGVRHSILSGIKMTSHWLGNTTYRNNNKFTLCLFTCAFVFMCKYGCELNTSFTSHILVSEFYRLSCIILLRPVYTYVYINLMVKRFQDMCVTVSLPLLCGPVCMDQTGEWHPTIWITLHVFVWLDHGLWMIWTPLSDRIVGHFQYHYNLFNVFTVNGWVVSQLSFTVQS